MRRGSYVTQGMKIGYITDYTGRTILEAHAPASGVVLYVRAVPSMTKGETIANIGSQSALPSRVAGHAAEARVRWAPLV